MRISGYACDRCGVNKEMITGDAVISSFAQIKLWGVGQKRTDSPQRIDLCEECYSKFVDFLERGMCDE